MAKLTGVLTPFPKFEFSGNDWEKSMKAQNEALEELQRKSDTLPEGEVVGAVLSFQVADGYAMYLVTKAKGNSIELKHIPFCDDYSIAAAHIRGLTKQDALAQREWRRKWHKAG